MSGKQLLSGGLILCGEVTQDETHTDQNILGGGGGEGGREGGREGGSKGGDLLR